MCLYSQARLDTLDSLDRMAELSQAEELKSKLLFSIIVVSTEYIRTKGVNQISWNTIFEEAVLLVEGPFSLLKE